MAYLADLASTNPLVTTMVAGASVEGRDIVQATISSDLAANKPIAWFDFNIHAREWITAATCIWIIDTVLKITFFCWCVSIIYILLIVLTPLRFLNLH